jgi:hypothetical protein
MKTRLFSLILLLISAISFSVSPACAQSPGTVGIGIKGGDPTGLSLKFYRKAGAIEVNAGRPYYFSGHFYDDDPYYRERFYKMDKFKGVNYYQYRGYTVSNPVAIQVHFLKSKGTKTAKELNWYYGLGPQLRGYKVAYTYYDNYHNRYYTDEYKNIDFGLDAVAGLEYTFSDLPLSVFADANLFLELLDNLGLGIQGGAGIRYNLK